MSKKLDGETGSSNWLDLTAVLEKSSTMSRTKKILGHVNNVYDNSVCIGYTDNAYKLLGVWLCYKATLTSTSSQIYFNQPVHSSINYYFPNTSFHSHYAFEFILLRARAFIDIAPTVGQ